jgi:hypothetical protein
MPKILPPLTAEQQQISDDFMKRWHEELAGRSRYGLIETFNHNFPVKYSKPNFKTTELGARTGRAHSFEQLPNLPTTIRESLSPAQQGARPPFRRHSPARAVPPTCFAPKISRACV